MATATESKIDAAKAEVAAEKAYAAAAASVEVKAEAKPAPVAKKVAAPKAAPAKKAPVKAEAPKAAPKKVAAKKAAALKAAPKKIVKAAPKAAATTPVSQLKDTIMTKTKTAAEDFTAKVKEAAAEAQERAKVAYDKGTELVGEGVEFTKGNVEALVESGKILAAGLQGLGKDYVAEGKSAFETVQADIKQLTAVKSPADFFKLQGEILRRNFDAAVAAGSKNSEAVVKLAGEAFAPIQNRVSIAIEKVKQAA